MLRVLSLLPLLLLYHWSIAQTIHCYWEKHFFMHKKNWFLKNYNTIWYLDNPSIILSTLEGFSLPLADATVEQSTLRTQGVTFISWKPISLNDSPNGHMSKVWSIPKEKIIFFVNFFKLNNISSIYKKVRKENLLLCSLLYCWCIPDDGLIGGWTGVCLMRIGKTNATRAINTPKAAIDLVFIFTSGDEIPPWPDFFSNGMDKNGTDKSRAICLTCSWFYKWVVLQFLFNFFTLYKSFMPD